MLDSAVVDLTSVPECDDDDQEDLVADGVDDAVVTDANSQSRSTPQSAGTWWAWIACQKRDGTLDARTSLRVEFS